MPIYEYTCRACGGETADPAPAKPEVFGRKELNAGLAARGKAN